MSRLQGFTGRRGLATARVRRPNLLSVGYVTCEASIRLAEWPISIPAGRRLLRTHGSLGNKCHAKIVRLLCNLR
jgi:hypothetical protein